MLLWVDGSVPLCSENVAADDDHVSDDERRRVQPDLARDRIDFFSAADDRGFLQVDQTVLAEPGDARTAPGVERDQLKPQRDVENPLLLAVAPVREAAPRQQPRRSGAARPSSSLCTHRNSPVPASRAITARRVPAVA